MCAHCFLSYCCTQGPHHPAAGRVNCITQSISLHYCETGPHDPAVEPVERHAHQSLLGARLRGEAQLLHCWHNLGPCSGRIAAVWPPRGAAHLHGYEVRRGLVKFNRRLALHSAAAKLCCRPGHSFKYDAAATCSSSAAPTAAARPTAAACSPARCSSLTHHGTRPPQVRDVSVSRDNSQFASVGGDKQVRVVRAS